MLCLRKSYLQIFDRVSLQEDIDIEISQIVCSGLCLQDVKTTVSVSVRVLRKGIKDFIQKMNSIQYAQLFI